MVHCAVPLSSIPVLATKLTEPVLHPIEETPDGTAAKTSAAAVVRMSDKMHAALIGPGLSHMEETTSFVREIVASLRLPIVLDADGLNAFKGFTGELKKHKGPLVITPHDGEWGRLFDPLPEDPGEALSRMQLIAEEFDLVIVRKGNPTAVVAPWARPVIIPTGNSGMASAGTGDVLTGIIASLLGQGSAGRDAAILGACVHGLCGEAATGMMGEHAVIAHDLIDALPSVLCRLGSPHTPGMLSV
jgi:NAD(P)H-hydrate epimerase